MTAEELDKRFPKHVLDRAEVIASERKQVVDFILTQNPKLDYASANTTYIDVKLAELEEKINSIINRPETII